MDKPTAIPDKSLLQRICEPTENPNQHLDMLQQRYCLVAPLILHEEVLDNLTIAPKKKQPAVFAEMVRRVRAMHPYWMDDVYEICYREIVLGESLDLMPWLGEEHGRMVGNFGAHDGKSVAWVVARRRARTQQIERRIEWQKRKIPPGKFFEERDERTFFQMLINLFLKQLSQPVSKAELLETFLGNVFCQRHPGNKAGIKTAIDRLSDVNINDFTFSRNYLIASLVYLIGPITKVQAEPTGRREPLKILDRQNQGKNSEDQEYVASAFLCERLLTGDEEMAKVMRMFQVHGLWPGKVVWVDRSKSLAGQIPALLI